MSEDEAHFEPASVPPPPGATETDIASRQSQPPSRRRRWRRRLGVSLLVLVLAFLATALYLVDGVNRRLAEAIAAADRDDPNWQINDLLAHRPTVPDAENSARVVTKAVSLLPENWPSDRKSPPGTPAPAPTATAEACDRASDTADNIRLDDATADTLRSELGIHHEAVRLARTLVSYDRGRHELKLGPNLLDTSMPETQAARNLARLLAADAAILAHDGDLDGALESCRALLGDARSIGGEPFVISQLVRVAIGNLAMKATRRVLGQGEPSKAAMARLQTLIIDELDQPLFLQGLRGERAVVTELIRRSGAGERSPSVPGTNEQASRRDPLRSSVGSWANPLFKNQQAIGIEWMNEIVAIARQPPHRRPPLWKEWEAKVDHVKTSRIGRTSAILPLLLIPALITPDSIFSRYQAELGATAILLAAERHRRTHGDWPSSIAVLDNAVLANPPVDPFAGKAFRAVRREGQFLIHSIGPDLTDQQGAYNPKRWAKGLPDDVGGAVWDVARRGQPAPPVGPSTR